MEKLKDILYDLSDVIISLVIIAVIFAVVSWKLNDAMPLTSTLFTEAETSESSSEMATEDTVDIVMTDSTDSTEPNGSTDSTDSTNSSDDQANTATTEPAETTTVATTATTVVQKTITIRSGSSGNAIARQLQREGIISDATEFLKVVDRLGVATRMQIGTFTLSSDMSYEQIALKLSGQ